jgi:hypothetical protein
VTQGRIEDIAGGYLMPRRQQTLAESAQAFEVRPLTKPYTSTAREVM